MPAQATNYGLVGGSSSSAANWTDPTAWQPSGGSTGGVPGAADNAYIGEEFNNGASPPWVVPAYVTLSGGTQQVSNIYLGYNYDNSQNVTAAGTLNVTGSATLLNIGNTLQMASWSYQSSDASATLNINAATVTVADPNNDSSVATGGGLNTAAISISNGGQLNFGGNLAIGNAASALATQATISLTASSQLNVGNGLSINGNSNININLDSSSQLNVGNDLALGGQGTYSFGLASTPTNGAVSFGGNLWIACGGQNNVSLTVNSGAPLSNYTGALNIASGGTSPYYTSSDQGSLTVSGNRTLSFAGGCNLATDYGTSSALALATLNLTNAAKLDFAGNLTIGGQYWYGPYDQYSSASVNVDGSSQLNAAGSLYVRGVGTYNLPLASTPTNGMVSFSNGLYVADNPYDSVSLTIGGSSATSMNFLAR